MCRAASTSMGIVAPSRNPPSRPAVPVASVTSPPTFLSASRKARPPAAGVPRTIPVTVYLVASMVSVPSGPPSRGGPAGAVTVGSTCVGCCGSGSVAAPSVTSAPAGSNRATRSANRTRSPARSTRGPVSLSSLTNVPPVELRSRIVTSPDESTVTSACRPLTYWSSSTRSATLDRPITICGWDRARVIPARSAGFVTTRRGVTTSSITNVTSPSAGAGAWVRRNVARDHPTL